MKKLILLLLSIPILSIGQTKKLENVAFLDRVSSSSIDVAVAKKFGFKADAAKRKNPRYKQIANLKKKFYNIALKIMKDQDIL